MSTEFKKNDRVSINKDLPYTTPRFGTVTEMRTIFTGTVNDYCDDDDEVVITLDYPYDVPEGHRVSYSYDPRDLTLISTPQKGNTMSNLKKNDKVVIDKSLKFTKKRFGTTREMKTILTGTVTTVGNDEVNVMLDYPDNVSEGKRIDYSYDPRDLTLLTEFKPKDKVSIDKNLTYTTPRFGVSSDMEKYFTGTVSSVYSKDNDERVYVNLKSNENNTVVGYYTYDPRDLTLISEESKPKKKGRPILDDSRNFPTPTNVKTSNNTTTVEFSDNTTTSVTKSAGDPYDLETAIAYCIAKKLVTNSCIKHLAKNAEEIIDKVDVEFYNKFLKPYGFLNEKAYTDVEIETLKNYLKTLNDVRSDLALIAIENDLSKDELFNKLKD